MGVGCEGFAGSRGRSHLFTQKGPLSIISSNEKLAPKGGGFLVRCWA